MSRKKTTQFNSRCVERIYRCRVLKINWTKLSLSLWRKMHTKFSLFSVFRSFLCLLFVSFRLHEIQMRFSSLKFFFLWLWKKHFFAFFVSLWKWKTQKNHGTNTNVKKNKYNMWVKWDRNEKMKEIFFSSSLYFFESFYAFRENREKNAFEYWVYHNT